MKILVVEDDETVARTLQFLLSSYHYVAEIATDGAAGLQMAISCEYDLILVDANSSALNGIGLCQQLRASGLQSPILLLTGPREGQQHAIALKAGADDYAVKPFEAEELMARVQVLLRRRCSTRQLTLKLAELTTANQELGAFIERLQLAQTELQQKHRDLEIAYQTIAQEREQLQAVREELERRVAERASELREREEFLSSIYDGAAQPIFVVDVTNDFYYVSLNRVALQSVGVSLQEVQGKTPEEVFGSTLGALFRQNYERCLQADSSITYEDHFVFNDRPVWTITTLSPLRNEAGKINRIVGTVLEITDRKQAEFTLQQQFRREQLIAEISQDIRQSLNLNHVLTRTVERVREFLNTDRAIVFRFRPNWQGEVITESVGDNWTSILSTTIFDPCFRDRYIEPYRQGRIGVLTDTDSSDLEPCYVELLKTFQVKANLVVPILQGEKLWGLLIAHHCSAPRQWQPTEIDLLRQLATHVGIAIQQSELYEQTRRELSAREQMQTVLEESEERFRTLSMAAPIGICQTNADGICLYTNTRWHQMSGLSFEDSLGNGWLQAVHPDDRDAILQAWQAYLEGGSECLPEFRLVTPQGEMRWISARVAVMRSAMGEVIGYVSIDEDITERKQAEQKIRQQAALLDVATDAISVRDFDQHILYWNQSAERLYGWLASEAIGQSALDLLQSDTTQLSEIRETLFRQGEWRGEMHKVTKTGKPVIVEARWTLVRDEAGQPQCILAVDTDVTSKKQLETQFYRAQRLESLGTLASGIAHDLNNVLTPILAISQLLRLNPQNLDARSQEMLKIIEDSARRGANMIKQILTFTRGTGGVCSPVEIAPLVQEAIDVIQQTFPKSIDIRYSIPEPSPWLVSADSTYLHQILMNLCVNARDAMPDGGILSVSVEPCFVDRALAQTNLDAQIGDYVVVTIADTGTGIPPEVRDRIFDPFFTTKAPGQGTGVGLTTVLGIVKNYGGFLQVFSEVGRGTQLKVYLPIIEGIAPSSSQPQRQLDGNGELILLVDDESAVQCSTRSLLESHRYTVLSANEGGEALELYAQHQAEIKTVILDIMMPNMSGFSLIQKLKERDPRVKIIAMSGLPSNRESALDTGANTFLLKPFTLENLLDSLQTIMTN